MVLRMGSSCPVALPLATTKCEVLGPLLAVGLFPGLKCWKHQVQEKCSDLLDS